MYTYPFVQISDMIVFPLLTPSVFLRPKQDSSLSMAQNDQPVRKWTVQHKQRICGSIGNQTQQKFPINGSMGKSLKNIGRFSIAM